MTKKYETNQKILTKDHGEIVLYLRSDHKNPKWQARIKIDGSTGYIIQSTRTPDETKATLVATDLYQALVDKFRSTGSTQTRTFKTVVKEWIQHLKNKKLDPAKISEFEERLNNYPVRLWGDKYIDQIQNADLEHFVEWRKTHGLHQQTPSLSTIKRDIVPLKGLFRFAYGEKYISQPPTFENISAHNKQRPAFTTEEWVQVVENLDKWILKVKHLHRRHLRDRVYLKYYILILGLSGIRPGTEARSLTWKSFTFENFSLKNTGAWVIRVPTGKSGKRTVVADTSLNQLVKDLQSFRKLELARLDKVWNEEEPVFCHEDGSSIQSFKTGFRSFLNEFDLLADHAGDTRVPYSLRHTYATRMINHGINHWDIAKNMGTSVAMLEKAYVHGNYKIYGINLADPDGTAPEQPIAVDSSLPITLPTPTYSLSPTISPTMDIRKIAALISRKPEKTVEK